MKPLATSASGAPSQQLQGIANWQCLGLVQEQPDAVVVIRGGGAVNDLAWLNDYELALCICELPVPVLTGIGHELSAAIQ